MSTGLQYCEPPSLSCTFSLALPHISPSLFPCCKREEKQSKKCESVKVWKCKSVKAWKKEEKRKRLKA